MNTAWMIRNDGKAFPCVQHIYASPKNVEETLLAAEWLYANTQHKECRQLALETIAAWAASISVDGNVTANALDAISRKPHRFLSQEFIMEAAVEIEAISTEKLHLNTLCSEVATELNQEFLRVQYGGVHHTGAPSKELFFRISSIGFDWYKIIHHFITSADFPIGHIIIVRDEESTDKENKFSLRLPTETFLAEQPTQLIPSSKLKGGVMIREIFAHLSDGSALRHISWDLAISASELTNMLMIISDWENRSRME